MDTLLDVCEPLFNLMCRLNRTASLPGLNDADSTKAEIKTLFEAMRTRSNAISPTLAEQFRQVEQPLIFFVDFMIKESPFPFAGRWKELAFEQGEMAGDEKFFELLDLTLSDKSDAATERLIIYYTCIGLGFTGWYASQPEYLRKKMREIYDRVRTKTGDVDASRICGEAYDRVDTRDLIEPAGTRVLGIAIAMVGVLVVLMVVNGFLYWRGASELSHALTDIKHINPNAGIAANTDEASPGAEVQP